MPDDTLTRSPGSRFRRSTRAAGMNAVSMEGMTPSL